MSTIPLFKVHMPASVKDALWQTLSSGFVGQGPRVEDFEGILREYFSNQHVLTLNSGTSGLQLALRLANVGYGDEVITTAMTCTATNMPILAAGAKIVWADINPKTGNIDPQSIAKKITSKTKAIIMVHWGGYPCDIEEINNLARMHNLKVIEDGAHALGAEYKGSKIGVHSDFVMFSLQAIKHITTVDGGLLLCKNQEDYERGKLLRWYGIDRNQPRKDFRCEEDIAEWGYKFHMNDVAATIGIEQMKYVDGILARQRHNAKTYDEAFKNINGVQVVPWEKDRASAFWLYTLHVKNRELFCKFLAENGIVSSQVHARNDKHTCFKPYQDDQLVNVTKFTETMMCIPVGWWLTAEQVEYIASKVLEYSRKL